MADFYKVTMDQLTELRDRCYKIHAVATLLKSEGAFGEVEDAEKEHNIGMFLTLGNMFTGYAEGILKVMGDIEGHTRDVRRKPEKETPESQEV